MAERIKEEDKIIRAIWLQLGENKVSHYKDWKVSKWEEKSGNGAEELYVEFLNVFKINFILF